MSLVHKLLFTSMFVPTQRVQDTYSKYNGPLGNPLVLTGLPGVGKTQTIQAFAQRMGVPAYTFKTESLQVEDLEGVMVGDGYGKLLRASDNEFVQMMIDKAQEGIIFVDELNTSSQKLDAAVRRLFLDREWCRRGLPQRVRVFAAMNPPETSMSGRPLSAPMANALCHIEVHPHSSEEWLAYMGREGSDFELPSMAEGEARMVHGWDKAWSQVFTESHAFFKGAVGMGKLHSLPENGEQVSGAWPSERSHTLAFNCRVTALALGMGKDVEVALFAGCVGTGLATEYFKHIGELALPSIETLLTTGWDPPATRPDAVYAVQTSLTHHLDKVLRGSVTNARIRIALGAWRQIARVVALDSCQDLALGAVQVLERRGFGSMISQHTDRATADIAEILKHSGEITPLFPLALAGTT